MDTLGKLGFVYDVEHVAPNGEVVERQHFHNLMPNEGIKWALAKTFVPKTAVPSWSSTTAVYQDYVYIYLSFFKNLFTPSKVFDSLKSFPDMANEIVSTDKENVYTRENRFSFGDMSYYSKLDIATNTLSFPKVETTPFENVLLTGLMLTISNTNSTTALRTTQNSLLLSEAFFPQPIQMQKGGSLIINCGCTLISS